MDAQELFQSGHAGSPPLQIIDGGGNPQHWQDSGEFSSQGVPLSDG